MLRIEANGWADGVERVVSPNCDRRPAGIAVELLVLHNISLPPGGFGGGQVHRLFTNTLRAGVHPFLDPLVQARVSAHFLVERDGRLTQFVSCLDRAWHAGASVFRGRGGCNDFSIGIELEGTDFTPFADAQYGALAHLVAALCAAYPIEFARGHSEIAPGRKTDPGPCFDWTRVAGLDRLHRLAD